MVANGAGTDGTLEISGGGSVTSGASLVGFGDGSTGMVTVTDGTWTNVFSLVVGAFGDGTVEISGPGTVTSDGGILGSTEDGIGTVRVGGGSWTNSNVLAVGESGTGLLEISGTGIVSNTLGVIGAYDTSTGTASVSGGTWTNSLGLVIGDEGEGTVNLTGGTLNAPLIEIAVAAGSTGTLNIGTGTTVGTLDALSISGGDGTATVNFNHTGTVSFLTVLSDSLTVNKLGNGTLELGSSLNDYTGGTTIDGGTLRIGVTGATGDGTITVLGSTISYADGVVENNPIDLQSDVNLEVLDGDNARQNGPIFETGGSYGITKIGEGLLRLTGANTFTGRTVVNEGVLTLRNGGSIDNDEDVVIGESFADVGLLRVNGAGAGATLTTQDRLFVGRGGDGRLVVSNGGVATADSVRIGAQVDGIGEVTVFGPGSELTSQSILNVGQRGFGLLSIEDGGVVNSDTMVVGRQVDSGGAVLLDGTDSRLNLTGGMAVGNRGDGELIVIGGSGISQNGGAVVGRFFDGVGAVGVGGANSFWEIGGLLNLGDQGLGFLEIVDGGRVEAQALGLGLEFDGEGLLDIADSGSILDLSGPSVVGAEGVGEMVVENNATVQQTGGASIGFGAESEGRVIVEGTGSTWQIGGNLLVAGNGFGVLRILDGGFVSSDYAEIGQSVDSLGRVNIDGPDSVLEQRGGPVEVGVDGFGRLNLRNGGLLDQSGVAAPIQVAVNAGSEGRVVIGSVGGGSPEAPGFLDVSGIHGGDGDARLVFRHDSDGYFFTRDGTPDGTPIIISGSTAVHQRAGGTLLTGANSYTGGTIINGGNLGTVTPTSLGTGPLDLNDGRLTAFRNLNIGDTFTWAGGDIFGQLGTDTTRINVDGSLDLTSPGTFEFVPDRGFQNKTDYLILTTTTPLAYNPATDFVGNDLFGLSPVFKIIGGELYVTYPGSLFVSGALLQNSNPVGTPFFAEFVVDGSVRTGTKSQSNTIRGLVFRPGSSLQVFNTLTVSDGTFNVGSGTGTLNGGFIFVPQTFTKTGGGSLVVNSDVNVQGATNVDQGSLFINGNFFSGFGFNVGPNGLLGGTGNLIGNLTNNGIVAPGNSIGTLTVDGNFTQTPGGTLQIEILNPSFGDRINITGAAFLAGTLGLEVIGNGLSFGDVVTLITAQGGINGGFEQITGIPAGFRARPWLTDGSRAYNLIFAPRSYTQVAQGENQLSLARALDQWIGVSSAEIASATLQLDLLREEAYPIVFEALLPSIYGSLTSTTLTQSFGDGRTVNQQALFGLQRLRAMAAASGEESAAAEASTSVTPSESTEAGSDSAGQSQPVNHGWRVWADARGMYSTEDPLSLDSEGGTILAGADVILAKNLMSGFYVGGQTQESRDSSPDYQSDGPRFGLYGLLSFAENAYLSGVFGGGTSDVSVTRPLAFGGSASGDTDGQDWFTRVETGYTFKPGGFQLTPFVGIQYSETDFDSFTESSGSVYALGIEGWGSDRFEGFIGADIAHPLPLEGQFVLLPYARLTLRDTFSQDDDNLNASLLRGAGPTFAFSPDEVNGDGFEYGFGLRLSAMETGWSLNLGYTGFSGDDGDFNQVNLGFSWDL